MLQLRYKIQSKIKKLSLFFLNHQIIQKFILHNSKKCNYICNLLSIKSKKTEVMFKLNQFNTNNLPLSVVMLRAFTFS